MQGGVSVQSPLEGALLHYLAPETDLIAADEPASRRADDKRRTMPAPYR